MKQELVNQALASLDAIIRDEIDGADPQKYTRIIAIAVQAHRMRRRTRRRDRVADNFVGAHHGVGMYMGPGDNDADLRAAMQGELVEDAEAAEDFGQMQIGGGGLVGRARGFRHLPDTGDVMDMVREVLSTLRPNDDPFDRVAKRLRALSEARSALHDARGDTTAIDAQIRDLTATLTDLKENPDAQASHPALVHSELLRRRASRGAGEEPVPRDRGEDDRARASSPQGTGGGGIETTVVADVGGSGAAVQ
jgi:hypothetical protein